ncbi:alginate lyase family protein [Nonomuraea angiospora]|uniref:alginate lyase family protein n=1 Tax=Nonomuraea angiospora TaxID=46172 RepID=UPI00344F01E2
MKKITALLAALIVASAPLQAMPSPAAAAADGQNLVPNPGFETTTPSTEACPAPAWCTPWQSSTYTIDTTVAAEGERSMRIDGSPTKKIGGFVTVPLKQTTTPIVHISAKVKLDAITLADYTDFPGAARVSLSFSYVDSAGSTVYTGSGLLGGILTGSTDWTTVQGTFKVPPLTTRVQIINTVQTSTGTMWVDDVRVTPGSAWLYPERATKKAAPGSDATFLVTVTNRRAVADTLRLAVDRGTVSPAVTAPLKPGESTLATVTVPGAGSAVLTATPSGEAASAQRATLTVEEATAEGGEPRVYATPAELETLRKRISGQPWAAKAFDTTVKAEADAWLGRPLDKTVFHGGWSGNFKCPGTNTMLTFDYDSPTSHRCPLDGKTYSGEPYDSAWVEIWHDNAAQGASDLALAYRVTGGEQYAAKARDILLYYADRFLAVPLNPLYGRIHYQSLDEAVAAIGLIDAYDLIRDSLTEAERVNIEGNLLRPLAELLISSPMATSNFQAWTAAAVHGVGAAIDDAGLRDTALKDTEFLLDKAIVSDGWWWEGSASYHLYALQALTQVAISAREKDYPHDPRFKSMYTTLLPYLYPDQTVPAAGDGGTWGRRFGPNFTMFAEWAYATYADPDFAAGLGLAYHNLGQPRGDRWALRYGADEIPKSSGVRQRSTTFRGLGETVLRGGEPANLIPNGDFTEAALEDAGKPASWALTGTWKKGAVTGRATQTFPVDGTRLSHLRLSVLGRGAVTLTFLDGKGRKISATEGETELQVPVKARAVRLAIDGGFERLDLWPADLARDGGFEDGGKAWAREGRTAISPLAYRGGSAAMARQGRWSSDIPVTGGLVGTVELKARVQGTGRIELSFVNKDGTTTEPVSTAFLGTWKAVAARGAVPREAVAARVALVSDRGVGFFDDVALLYGSAVDPFQADAIRMDHGIPGGSHGHADKLHIDVTGGGLQSTDLGMVYGSDNADLTNNWYRETVSHNTVVVDGRSQDRAMRGSLNFFGTTPGLRVADAGAKDGDVAIRRADLMTDRYTLDVFDASGSTAHRYDQSWHGQGTLEVGGPAMTPPPCGDCVLDPADTDFGYHRLKRVAEGTAADGRWKAQWTSDTGVLSLRSLEPVSTGVLHTSGPGEATTGKPIPFLLARREGAAKARFTTLIETRSPADRPAVSDGRRIADGHVQVDLADGLRDDVLFDSGYALLRRAANGSPVSVDLMRRAAVSVDGVDWVKVSRPIERASVAYAGSELRLTVPRGEPGRYEISVHAPGVHDVTLNTRSVKFARSGDMITVAVTVS